MIKRVSPALFSLALIVALSAQAGESKKSSDLNGGNEINYDDPNLAMSNDYVTEMPVTCTDGATKPGDEPEECKRPSAVERATELPIVNAIYLVESVNAQKPAAKSAGQAPKLTPSPSPSPTPGETR